MPSVQQRQLSPGERNHSRPNGGSKAAKRRRAKHKKKPLVTKRIYHDRFIAETALAWDLPYEDVYRIHRWVGRKIEVKEWHGLIFTKLLRRLRAQQYNQPPKPSDNHHNNTSA